MEGNMMDTCTARNRNGIVRRRNGLFIACFIFAVSALMLSGCVPKARPGVLVEQYAFEYSPSGAGGLSRIDAAIRIERFDVAREYNARDMVYQPEPYKRDTYQFSRWRANPGDLVTDYFLRDMREAGVFSAVFSYYQAEDARFVLEGGVVEFLEVTEGGGRKAALALSVTLLDMDRDEIPERIVFQKKYSHRESIGDKSPAGLAEAMSQAMQKLSGELIADIHAAAADR
jgi:ABC-type uncharacterized transport system auxiliary subunit